ncbi:MAG: TonB-dependent receptor, partial [Acidobacteria bacterium]|nr:TonB-dependent receptor [Acidobacteriota bacterium]
MSGRVIRGLCAVVVLALPQAALPQSAPPTQQTAVSEGSEDPEAPPPTFDEEVVVSAQRREEALVDVPIAITSTSVQRLEESVVLGLKELGEVVPGMRVDQYGAYTQPTIRGVGTQDVIGPGASANVAIYVDEF